MPAISKIAKEMKPSATLSLKEEVSSVEKEYGFKIIDLTAGQPDVGPTKDVLEALLDGGKLSRYGPVQGDPELKEILSGVINEGFIKRGSKVLLPLTGSGLKLVDELVQIGAN